MATAQGKSLLRFEHIIHLSRDPLRAIQSRWNNVRAPAAYACPAIDMCVPCTPPPHPLVIFNIIIQRARVMGLGLGVSTRVGVRVGCAVKSDGTLMAVGTQGNLAAFADQSKCNTKVVGDVHRWTKDSALRHTLQHYVLWNTFASVVAEEHMRTEAMIDDSFLATLERFVGHGPSANATAVLEQERKHQEPNPHPHPSPSPRAGAQAPRA